MKPNLLLEVILSVEKQLKQLRDSKEEFEKAIQRAKTRKEIII